MVSARVLPVSYLHINAVRDQYTTTEDYRLMYFAICAASWVNHTTGILRASWDRLAKPIAKPGKPAPRATAIRYMAELEQLGMFKLIAKGKPGRGEKFNTWQFMWHCGVSDEDEAINVPRAEGAMEHCDTEDAAINVPKNGINVPKTGINVPRSRAKDETGEGESIQNYPEPPSEKISDPKSNCSTATPKANGEDRTATPNDNAKDRALAELRAMFGLGKRTP
jgi:hypothetical protein